MFNTPEQNNTELSPEILKKLQRLVDTEASFRALEALKGSNPSNDTLTKLTSNILNNLPANVGAITVYEGFAKREIPTQGDNTPPEVWDTETVEEYINNTKKDLGL